MGIGPRLGARLGYWRTLTLATVGVACWIVGAGCIQLPTPVPESERCKMGAPGACSAEVCAAYEPDEVPPGCLGDVAEGDLDVAGDAIPDGPAEETLEEVGPEDADAVADTPNDDDAVADGLVEDAPSVDVDVGVDVGLDAGDGGAVDAGACVPPVDGCPCAFTGTHDGVCGTAVYGADGVCAAPLGFQTTEASCDGLDNDCDGATDEACADGEPCDDEDPCTVGDHWNNGVCHGHLGAFTATYGGADDDQISSLMGVPDGGFVLLGATRSKGAGSADWWLVRTDFAGVLQWDQTYGGSEEEKPSDVIALSAGGFALAGYTTSDSAGKSDGWLVRTGASGDVLWDHSYGGTSYDVFHSAVALPDGGFALAGRTASTGAGQNDSWLVRTKADGTLLWEKTYGGAYQEDAYSVMALPGGGFVVAGSTESKGAGAHDAWLVRTDSAGSLVWDQTYGGAESDDLYDAVTLSDGGFALAGSTMSKGSGTKDFWLFRTDSNGTLSWDQAYGGSNDDVAYTVAALPDGGFALAGATQSSGVGGKDLWLVRTDANGSPLWDKTLGGAGDDWASALVTLPDGGFAMGGTNSSEGAGLKDFWLVRTDAQGLCP